MLLTLTAYVVNIPLTSPTKHQPSYIVCHNRRCGSRLTALTYVNIALDLTAISLIFPPF